MFDRSGEFSTLIKDTSASSGAFGWSMARPNKSESELEAGQDQVIKTAPLLDDFLGQMETVRNSMERIGKLMTEIEALHRSALATPHASESAELNRKIEASLTLASTEAAEVRKLLKLIDAETRAQASSLSSSDYRLRSAKHRALCKKFLALMDHFESMQKVYRNKYRQQLERQFLLIKPDASKNELEHLHSEDISSQMMSQQIFKMVDKLHAQQALDDMKERRAEIQKIERSMTEIHQMFLDVSFIISQHGFIIDKVDEYVQSSLEVTEQAAEVMHQTVIKHRRAQRRRWIMSTLGLIVLMVLVVIVVLALTNNL